MRTMSLVRGPMQLVPESVIRRALRDRWGLQIDELVYVPEGGGAYHWTAIVGDRRWFVTCDDLDTKPWLGDDRDTVFEGLVAAYRTAMHLREGGLEIVAAPVADSSGSPAVRLDARHSLAVLEHVDGAAGE